MELAAELVVVLCSAGRPAASLQMTASHTRMPGAVSAPSESKLCVALARPTSEHPQLMVPDIRRFAKKVEAAAAASSKRGGSNSGGGGGFRFAYQEEPGRVHSWPMLMLPHLRDKQEPFFAFVERSAGLQPASKA